MLATWLVAMAVAAPGPCRIEGAGDAWRVSVAPDAATRFDVTLDGARIEVTLTGGDDAVVRGVSPLAFEARSRRRDVPLGVARAGWITPLVHASTATWLVPRAVHGGEVEVEVDVGGEVRLEPVTLPCSGLTLRSAERDWIEHEPGPVGFLATVLPLQARPDRGAVYSLVLAAPTALTLHELDERKGWVRVEARWTDGTKVRGWTPSEWLERDHNRIGLLRGLRGQGACGIGRVRILPPGTAVHAGPDGARWATITSPTHVTIDTSVPGWWRVLRLPGLAADTVCGAIEHVWVEAPRGR